MFEFNPVTHSIDTCVECGDAIPTDIDVPLVFVELDGETRKVGGLYRCLACQAFIEIGAISSNIDLKAAYEWLRNRIMPSGMLKMTEAENALTVFTLSGAPVDAEAMEAIAELTTFMLTAGPELMVAGDLMDALDEHFGTESMEYVRDRMVDLLHKDAEEEVKDMSGDELDELIEGLDLKRGEDGTVTYACPNPTCPDGESRHPLAFAEPILPDRVVAALVGRLPE